jgi:Tfp pilus assembly protein PilO
VSRRGPLIAIAVGLALAVLVVAALILPKASQVRARQKQVVAAKQQEQTLQVQLQELQADAKQAGAEHKALAKLNRQVPPTADLPGIIRTINSIADQSNVDFMVIAPGQPVLVQAGGASSIPTQITLVGHFFAIDQFLFRLEGLARAAKVLSVQVNPGPKSSTDPGQIQVMLSTEFYTTDVSAGPGSVPGSTQTAPAGSTSSTGSSSTPSPSPSGSQQP